MRSVCFRAFLCISVPLFGTATAADPPGLAVASSDPQAAQPTGSITVSAGRFVPLAVAGGKPSLVLGNEAGLVELFTVTPATELVGVRYDEPAGAKAKRYTFKKDVTHVAIGGDMGGVVRLTAIVNGTTPTSPPTVAGELVLTLTAPLPPPRPDPKPDPKPDPVTGKLFAFILIEETATAWPQRGQTMLAANTWADTNGIKRRWVDKDVVDATGKPPADMVPWLNKAKGKTVPYLFLVTDKGGILWEGESPLTPTGITELMGRFK